MSREVIEDPDLVQAIEELQHVARRLEWLDRELVTLDDVEKYHQLARMRAERSDHRDVISARAEKLAVPARALLLLVDQANRMRTPRRKDAPTLNALANAIAIAAATADRNLAEAEADAKLARLAEREANTRAKAAADALNYLEASRA